MADTTVTALEDLYPAGSWACAHRKGDSVPYATAHDKKRVRDQGWVDKITQPVSDEPAAGDVPADDEKGN